MKQVCLYCERMAPDDNLWCQELYCHAELSPTLLDYGEWLSDIEIIKSVAVLRSSVLYEATQNNKKIYIKVAHQGEKNKEKLKREASFLKEQQLNGKQDKMLPKLLPAYLNASLEHYYYGKAMFQGQLLYFYLFEYFSGEPLRDVLLKNPQPWFNHVGWISISLASVIAYLHDHGLFHLCLTPDTILIQFDKKNIPRILLFDLGAISNNNNIHYNWDPLFIMPSYTAPELIQSFAPVQATDVYNIGLILYEMLIGEPPITSKFQSDKNVYTRVLKHRLKKMDRPDLERIAEIASTAVNKLPEKRQPKIIVLADELTQVFGEVPNPLLSQWPTLHTIGIAIAAILTTAFFIAIAVSLL